MRGPALHLAVTTLALLLAAAGAAAAEQDGAPPPPPEGEVASSAEDTHEAGEGVRETVVVTASKRGQKITEAPAAVTVITAEDIQASGAANVAELFRRVPGLDFMQVSARDYNVNARGFNNLLSRRLLVLIDGRSVYLTILGFTLWDGIQVTMDDIERIEVVRGPGSALYGANASSGVVNIITKSPRQSEGTLLRAGYGELATFEAGARFAHAWERWGMKVAASDYQTEGFPNPEADADSRYGEGKTATRQPRITSRLQHDGADGGTFQLDAGWGTTSGILYTAIGPLDILPGSTAPYARTSYTKGGLYLQAFWNRMESETLNLVSLQENFFTTDSYDVEAQYGFDAGERHTLVLGGNARSSNIVSDLTLRSEVELYYGLYAQDDVRLSDRFTANLALRVDHDALVGTVTAPKAGLVFTPREGQAFRLTASTAYNSSSLIESYLDFGVTPDPNNPDFVVFAKGNPELEPERITSYEAGFRGFVLPRLLVDANLFHARLKDFVSFIPIEFYSPGVPRTYTFINAGKATEAGVELSAEWYATAELALLASWSYTSIDQSDEVTDVFARNKASVTLQRASLRGLSGSITVAYTSSVAFREISVFYPTGVVPSYTIVNGALSWAFREGAFSLALKGTNLLDRDHREFIVGDLIGRKVVLEATARF